MAYVYLNDGPEAEEFASNYVYFDEKNPRTMALVESILSERGERDAAFRARLREACRGEKRNERPFPKKERLFGFFPVIWRMA